MNARSVANVLIQKAKDAGEPITPLQIQKLLYFSHGWMLALHDKPLLNEEFQAWRYGPVMPVVYYNLSYYGGDPVEALILGGAGELTSEEESVIDQVFELYRPYDGMELSRMTHAKGTPWRQTWDRRKRAAIIPDYLIKRYFQGVRERAQKASG